MTSRRASWDLSENRLAQVVGERRAAGGDIIDLVESNPTRVGIAYPAERIRAALSVPDVLGYEPSPKGLSSAREAVSRHYEAAGVRVDPADVLLTASTSEAYGFLFKLLADPGDEVLVPRPSYPLFDYLAGLDSVEPRRYRLVLDGEWRIDLDSVERAIGPRTRAIVLVHPNNPTGSFVRQSDLDAVANMARGAGLALVSDEVFADWILEPGADRAGVVAERRDVLTFSLGGLSKGALLPQVKLAWIAVGGPNLPRADALARLEVISDTYLSVSASAQLAAPILLAQGASLRREVARRIAANLAFLRAGVAETAGIELLSPEGGWHGCLRLPARRSDEEWAVLLAGEEGVAVHPGSFYDFEEDGIVVVSLLQAPTLFEAGVSRLLARVGE